MNKSVNCVRCGSELDFSKETTKRTAICCCDIFHSLSGDLDSLLEIDNCCIYVEYTKSTDIFMAFIVHNEYISWSSFFETTGKDFFLLSNQGLIDKMQQILLLI